MKTCLDCIPCFVRQALAAARMLTADVEVHETIVRDVLLWTAEIDFSISAPAMAQRIHRRLRHLLDVDDPYAEVKRRQNEMGLSFVPILRKEIASAEDPFALALRLAVAGNVIDLGVSDEVSREDISEAIHFALSKPILGDIDRFRDEVHSAQSILYLTDNAGEVAFDRLFIEQLPKEKIVIAVRGGPAINDATLSCAEHVGLTKLAKVIDNGTDAPGTLRDQCSDEFNEHWANSSLVIAKGQGNFESLNHENANIFFLFKAKCDVVAKSCAVPKGSCLLRARHECA